MALHRAMATTVVFLAMLAFPLAAVDQDGMIIVEKQTDPDGAPDSFSFSGDASGSISDGGQIVVHGLQPGVVYVDEPWSSALYCAWSTRVVGSPVC